MCHGWWECRVERGWRSLEPGSPDHVSPSLCDRLGDVRRRFRVVVELHRERGAALRHRAQRGRVAEHLAQRQLRIDDLARRTVVLALQDAATTADVAHHVTEIVFGGDDLDLHDRLEQDRAGLVEAFLEAHRAGDLRSEEHTSELPSLMRNSYAVFCL